MRCLEESIASQALLAAPFHALSHEQWVLDVLCHRYWFEIHNLRQAVYASTAVNPIAARLPCDCCDVFGLFHRLRSPCSQGRNSPRYSFHGLRCASAHTAQNNTPHCINSKPAFCSPHCPLRTYVSSLSCSFSHARRYLSLRTDVADSQHRLGTAPLTLRAPHVIRVAADVCTESRWLDRYPAR